MLLILSIVFFSFNTFSAVIFAKEPPVNIINGTSRLEKVEYDSLESNGNLNVDHLSVKNSLVVNGSVKGKKLKCKTLNLNGSFNIVDFQANNVESNGFFVGENVDIAGDARFNGDLKITNGRLGNLIISSSFITLINAEVKGYVHIKKVSKGSSFFDFGLKQSLPQTLELKENTIIFGDVVFEEYGYIHLFDKSEVRGKIINGKLVRK